jgi:lysozyme
MKTSANGIQKLRGFEGCVLTIYKDQAGLDTIGVGHLITDAEKANSVVMALFHAGLSPAQADALLAVDVTPAEQSVNQLVKVVLTQDQFDSLVSFVFNVGAGALASSSLLKALNANATHDEIRADFLKWDKIRVNGQLVENAGLKARRQAEASAWA